MNREYTIAHLFAGIGGGAIGAAAAEARIGEEGARFRTIGGVDVDPASCRDFERLTGAPALCADVHTLEPAKLREAWGDRRPDVVLTSPPCKGFSGLLSTARSLEPKYQTLNRLLLDGLFLLSSTWDEPPPLIFVENVPRITVRGKELLRQARATLLAAGYAVTPDDFHDCGELGNLAQHRRRWFLVARCKRRVPVFVYQPQKHRVRACGEVLGELPIPLTTATYRNSASDDAGKQEVPGGPMHVLPRLSWRNWVRLSLIPAGGDWRDLPGALPEGTKRRERFKRHRVEGWQAPVGTVGGSGSNGVEAVADPRHTNIDHVVDWDQPARTVTSATRPGGGAPSVADPRLADALGVRADTAEDREAWEQQGKRRGAGTKWFKGKHGVAPWDQPARTVVGGPSNGAAAVSDPRVSGLAKGIGDATRGGALGVVPWEQAAPTVTGQMRPGGSNTPAAVADPRIASAVGLGKAGDPTAFGGRPGQMRVLDWDQPTGAVTGGASIMGGSAARAVSDPRLAAELGIGQGPTAHRNKFAVRSWDEPAATAIGATRPGSGGPCVADPRAPAGFGGVYGVRPWDEPASTVTGQSRASCGAHSVADPRLGCEPRNGAYRVLGWEEAAASITGSLQVDNGPAAVADPRCKDVKDSFTSGVRTPSLDPDKPPPFVPLIVAADGTWHRPLTTLELAALQGFPILLNGAPLVLDGTSHGRWREAIGNAIPPPAARAIAEQLLWSLLASELGEWALRDDPVWVAPEVGEPLELGK